MAIIVQSINGTERPVRITKSAVYDVELEIQKDRRFTVCEEEFAPPPKRPGPYQAPGRSRHKKGK